MATLERWEDLKQRNGDKFCWFILEDDMVTFGLDAKKIAKMVSGGKTVKGLRIDGETALVDRRHWNPFVEWLEESTGIKSCFTE